MRIAVAIVGCGGGRGRWFAMQAAAHPAFRITAFVDHLTETAEIVRAHLGLDTVPVYADLAEALRGAPVDAVLIATPDSTHTDPVLAALAAGKHVFVEKPLAISLADCLRVVEADRTAGGRTMVGFNLRLAPLYARARTLLEDGLLGRLHTIQADDFYYGGRTYFRRWNRTRAMGGGLWVTKACHDFDLLYWLARAMPKRVSAFADLGHYGPKPGAAARCRDCAMIDSCPDAVTAADRAGDTIGHRINRVREAVLGASAGSEAGWSPDLCLYNSDKDTFDHGVAQVEFDNGILATYTVNVVSAISDRRLRLAGSDGMLEGALSSPGLHFWKRHRDYAVEEGEALPLLPGAAAPAEAHGGGDAHLLDRFAAFVRGEGPPPVAPAEASISVALGLAATRASDERRTIALDEFPEWRALTNEALENPDCCHVARASCP